MLLGQNFTYCKGIIKGPGVRKLASRPSWVFVGETPYVPGGTLLLAHRLTSQLCFLSILPREEELANPEPPSATLRPFAPTSSLPGQITGQQREHCRRIDFLIRQTQEEI